MYPGTHSILYKMSQNNRFKSEQVLYGTGFAGRPMQLRIFFFFIAACNVLRPEKDQETFSTRLSYKVRTVYCSEELLVQLKKDG